MSSSGAIGGAKRAARIRRIVEDVMVRRARGEGVPDANVIGANPDLMPDLARELSLLSMLERARASATGRSRTGHRMDGPIEPLGEDAFAGFRVVREIRRGGQGVVYEAVQASTGRRVAIKMMREGLFGGDRDGARFEREVRILGQLEHPGIVGILASGIRGGHFYYAMDYVEGSPLDQYAQSIGRRLEDVMRVMEKVADAVNAAHLRGIIHRDLKPGNILVDGEGQARILDFGLARVVSDDVRMTATGQFVGSMPWASPEQARGDQARIDLRTDVYSLGVILYQALTGKFPYEVESGPRDALDNILHSAPERPRSVSALIDEGAEAITLKCLSKEPERRYQSAGELAADIRRYLSGRPVVAHPPSAWYQARMLARRHRALVIGGAAVVAALLLGLIGTSIGLVQASASRRAALRERDEAQSNAYAASVAAADSAIRVEDAATAKAQLRAAPEALRGWEWRYLAARADQSQSTLDLPPVWDAKVAPDGESLLVIRRDRKVCLTDQTGRSVRWITTLPEGLGDGSDHHYVIGYSHDGRMAATQHMTGAIVWNLLDGSVVRQLQFGGSWGYVTASFSPDGEKMLTSGREGMLQMWDLATGEVLATRSLSAAHSPGADFSPDGRTIAATVGQGFSILDARTLESIREVQPPGTFRPDWGYIRYSPDGAWIVACCSGYIAAMDPEGKRPPIEFRGGTQVMLPFALSRDGSRIAAGSWDCSVRVWDFRTGELRATLVGHEGRVMSATFAGERVVSTGGEGDVKTWDVQGGTGAMTIPGSFRHRILPEGDTALSYGSGRLSLADLTTGGLNGAPVPHTGLLWGFATSPDGRLVATSDKNVLHLWNLSDGISRWRSESRHGAIFTSALSADGSQIASIHVDGFVEMRDAATGTVAKVMDIPKGQNCWMSFHPKRPQLVISGYWPSFIVIDAASWEKHTVSYPREYGGVNVVQLAYNGDGSILASCDSAGGVLLWRTASWTPFKRLTGMRPTTWAAAFSPDGERLAIGAQDRMIHIFETRHWRETLILRGHTGSVGCVEWTPDGRRLVSSGSDGTMRIWDAAPARWHAGPTNASR